MTSVTVEWPKMPPLLIFAMVGVIVTHPLDSGFTCDTSVRAALRQRVNEKKANWLVYVTDTLQATHLQPVFACAEKAGYIKEVRVDHVDYGVVLGEDKEKFKTRKGGAARCRVHDLHLYQFKIYCKNCQSYGRTAYRGSR